VRGDRRWNRGRPLRSLRGARSNARAESLINVAKHAHASGAAVRAQLANGSFRLQVSDDGIGGARPDGSGFVGLADRLAVLDCRLRVQSPTGGGTVVTADIRL
jgi:signal transduction histidine kinase